MSDKHDNAITWHYSIRVRAAKLTICLPL